MPFNELIKTKRMSDPKARKAGEIRQKDRDKPVKLKTSSLSLPTARRISTFFGIVLGIIGAAAVGYAVYYVIANIYLS